MAPAAVWINCTSVHTYGRRHADGELMTDSNKAATTFAATKPCPICGKPRVEKLRPFCSRRCADIDLHRWLGGSYAIPAAEQEEDEAQDTPPRDEESG